MDFLMESGFMHWMSERMSFTNWVKADFHETSRITLKFSAPPRLRVRYRLGAGSSRYGNCFFEGYHIGECRAMTYASIMLLGLPWRWGKKILKYHPVAK